MTHSKHFRTPHPSFTPEALPGAFRRAEACLVAAALVLSGCSVKISRMSVIDNGTGISVSGGSTGGSAAGSTGSAASRSWPFTTSTDYTFNASLIQVSGG